MKRISLFITLFVLCIGINAQNEAWLQSPNGKIAVGLESTTAKSWYLTVQYTGEDGTCDILPSIKLGLKRSDADFKQQLTLAEEGTVKAIREEYTALHGKRKHRINEGNERQFTLRNNNGKDLVVVVRAYNDGVAFRYEFNEGDATAVVQEEYTAYEIPSQADRWMQHFVPWYEGEYPHQKGVGSQGEWGFPALVKADNAECWMIISEANVDRNYCATKLSNQASANIYKVTFPAASEGNGIGDVQPTIPLTWKSPWRLAIIGGLNDIMASTLVEDVSDPCKVTDTDWIQPGVASWIYWAYNHGTKDYKLVCNYIDLAASMGWPYVLFDWEWDAMSNGGTLEDAVAYAKSKGVKPWIWLNSGGDHNNVSATPRSMLVTHEKRVETYEWLTKLGVYGIKVDFFESDKQHMMNYYIDILEDAIPYKIMVNFHGATVPRGWSRTYPHLMSVEAVFGAEQYNNGGRMTEIGHELNTILPFTRNVVGPMDYTPVAFTNSQHPHTTSYAHEIALSVVFESGMQHMADRPSGFYALKTGPKDFLSNVPAAWDDTELVSGYPGRDIVMRRTKADTTYIAGLNGTSQNTTLECDLDFLTSGKTYKMLLVNDGETTSQLTAAYSLVEGSRLSQACLSRGGFAARITPFLESDLTDLLELSRKTCEEAALQIGNDRNDYKEAEVQNLLNAIQTVESSGQSAEEKYAVLAEAYTAFCENAVITSLDDSSFTPTYTDRENLVQNPTCNTLDGFGGWGTREINTDPAFIYSGDKSIAVRASWGGTLEIVGLQANKFYRFIAQTYSSYGQLRKFGLYNHGMDGGGDIFMWTHEGDDCWQKADFTFQNGPNNGAGIFYVGDSGDGNVYIDNFEAYEVAEPYIRIQYLDAEGNPLKEEREVRGTWGRNPETYLMIGAEFSSKADKEEFEKDGVLYVYDETSNSDRLTVEEGENILALRFVKAEGPSNNVKLKSLSVEGGTLKPAFDPDITEYSVTLVGAQTVTPAYEAVNDSQQITGAEAVDLTSGSGTSEIVVTAEDGVTTRTYTITYKCIPSDDSFEPTYTDRDNVVPNVYCNTLDGFGGWGTKDVNSDLEYVHTGYNSIRMTSHFTGTLEINNLQPYTTYRVIAQTYATPSVRAQFGWYNHGLGSGDIDFIITTETGEWQKADFTFKTAGNGGGLYFVATTGSGYAYIDNFEMYIVEEPYIVVNYVDEEGNTLKPASGITANWTSMKPADYFNIGELYVVEEAEKATIEKDGFLYEYDESSVDSLTVDEGENVITLKFKKCEEVGISAPAATSSEVDVYTLLGQLVRRSVAKEKATDGLRPGIYIVGGKKMLVK